MIRWADVPRGSLGDEQTAASEAQAFTRCLAEQGVDPGSPHLRGAGPVSVHQQLSMLREASQCARDPLIAVRVGLELHPTSYGTAGRALLSSASLRQALRIVIDYGALLRLKVRVDLEQSGSEARLVLKDCFDLAPKSLELGVQFEVAKLCTLLRDLSGCCVSRVELSSPQDLCAQLEKLLGAPVRCGMATNCVSFDSELLDKPLPQADATTHQICLRSCDERISTLRMCDEIRRRVRRMIISANGAVPTLAQVAARLFLSTRTLRRRLEDAQTSYHEIVGETRRDLAVDYLAHTSLSTEAITELLGYSDTANFRQAFKRWTGESPQRYRRLARSGRPADRLSEAHSVHLETNAYSRYSQRSAVAPSNDGAWTLSTC
jgi:AraC-like DNA-binding protein